MLRDPNKLEETPSCSRAQIYDDSLQTHSDKRDKSRAVFNFPAFVSLFYSVLRDVESNNSFLLCVWTQCTASVFVRNSIIKRDMNGKTAWKKESEHGFNWCLPVVWPLFPSPSFFCLPASLGLIRPAVESGPLGKHSRVWLNEAEIGASGGGGGGASWGATTSDHFPQCNTPCSLEHWQAAASSLPFVFSPSLLDFLPFHPTFLPLSHFLSCFAPSHFLFFPFLFFFLLSFFLCSLPWKTDSYSW